VFFINPASPLKKWVVDFKSLLINGENLYQSVKTTLNKQIMEIIVQLQRLNEETCFAGCDSLNFMAT
jgi:hypothetical protein